MRGFTMVEVMFAMVIFLMAILVFAAVFPFAITGARYANNYAQASMIAQQKIEELKKLSWSGLDLTNSTSVSNLNTTLTQQNLVDSGSCSVDTSSPPIMTCSFVNTDNVGNNGSNVGYFPAGTTAKFTIQSDTNASNQPPVNDVFNIRVTITWPSAGAPGGSYTTAFKAVEMGHA